MQCFLFLIWCNWFSAFCIWPTFDQHKLSQFFISFFRNTLMPLCAYFGVLNGIKNNLSTHKSGFQSTTHFRLCFLVKEARYCVCLRFLRSFPYSPFQHMPYETHRSNHSAHWHPVPLSHIPETPVNLWITLCVVLLLKPWNATRNPENETPNNTDIMPSNQTIGWHLL